ncbi:MAG: NAD(P)/FAD-dependent oxidoreductase [Chloroflexota bacterium]|nr:NAD(P)/FAD-dependent oxidoreductase [Chloroflexota bacterium]
MKEQAVAERVMVNVPSNQYDAVIIGGGHNGLVAACYLARAGFKVCVLERYTEVGGAAISEEIAGAPGHIASTGSYVLSLAPRKILDELDLWENGVELIPRNPRSFAPLASGDDGLVFWEDQADLLKELARFSPRDAAAYPDYDALIERACAIMDQFILRNPPSYAEFAAAFNQPGDERIFKYMILGSAADLAEYYFESEIMQAAACALGLIGTFRGPRDAGTGYVKLYHSMGMSTGRRGAWAYVRGAMGSVTQALARVARGLGVEIRTGNEVAQVCIQNGRATGVATRDGEEFHSRIVLSNADPHRTYLKLVDRQQLPGPFINDIEAIQFTSPVMKINLATTELPRYKALAKRGYELGQLGGVHIGPSIDYLQKACDDARRGEPSDWPFFSIHAQSAHDRSLAPEGKQTISIFTQYFPYTLAEGTWDERRDEIARHVIARFAEYAPNIAGAVIEAQVLAPPDIEARFGLTGGHIFQGELVPEQAFDLRPVPGSTSYEGPIHGLYLCGAGAWPGGCVMGAPGHNAAHEAIMHLKAGRYD